MSGNRASTLLCGYHGDECLGVKTAAEWAEERGCKVSTIIWMASPARIGRIRDEPRSTVFYRVDDDEEEAS